VSVLAARLRADGHEVRVVATAAALYFDPLDVGPAGAVVRDEDEWPGRGEGRLAAPPNAALGMAPWLRAVTLTSTPRWP
jgi:hypothetical protein